MLNLIVASLIIFACFVSVHLAQNDPPCGVKGPSHASTELGIVGGDDAAPFEFAWQGALLSDDLCGGSILNDRWIITAGHCVTEHESTQLKDVTKFDFVAGSLSYMWNAAQPRTIAHVEKSFLHPKYALQNGFVNDVALLKLTEALPLSNPNKHLVPICLPKEHEDLDYLAGTVCTTTGWGRTSSLGNISENLKRVNVTIQKQEPCEKVYENMMKIDKNMICAGDQGKGTCDGDAGGPLICYLDGKWNLVGVTSFRYDCAYPNFPDVYVRISEFLPWIKETIANN